MVQQLIADRDLLTQVRAAAIAPVVTTPIPASAATSSPTADRLKDLDALRQQRLITEEEYQATRKRILEGF